MGVPTINGRLSPEDMLYEFWASERASVDDGRRQFLAQLPADPTRNQIAAAMRRMRGPLIDFFFVNPTEWREAMFPVSALRDLLVTRFMEPNKTMGQVLDNPRGSPRFDYASIPDFDPLRFAGAPIFVGPTADGPWCLVEGSHRSLEMIRLADRDAVPFDAVRAVLGICPRVRAWHFWPIGM